MSLRVKLVAAACGVVLAASVVLGGSASAASASPQSRASSSPAAGYAVARTTAVNPAAVTPDSTPTDSWCRGQSPSYYGWFGVAPGSSADGGVANDLWWDAKDNAAPAQMQVYSGNGGANQQWCERYLGSGIFEFFADYASSKGAQCLTVDSGYDSSYDAGLRVYADNCGNPALENTVGYDQMWYVCPRSGGSISLEPTVGVTWYSKSVWLDVWGGSSDNGESAFKPMNPLQIWNGNGQDNQRFTLFPSPGEPSGLGYAYTTGVAGC